MSHSLQEVADKLQMSRREFISWLRRYNLIKGMKAATEFILTGYFIQRKILVRKINHEVDYIEVTQKGLNFIMKLRKVLDINIVKWENQDN